MRYDRTFPLELFSSLEKQVIKIVGKTPQSVRHITSVIYHGRRKRPMDANNGVAQAIRRINKKCDYHNLDWFLNGAGQGRGGKLIWVDRNL
jgi:hypothetical protein